MRRSLLLAVMALGCSLDSAGLSDEVPPVDDGATVDTTIGTADTELPMADGSPIFEADIDDTTMAPVDSTVPVDTAMPDTAKPDTVMPIDTNKPDVVMEVDAGCKAPTPTANPCSEIPHREELAVLGTGQVLDGRADDFCDVPYVDFNNWTGVIRAPDPVPMSIQATMRIRTAWSSFGMHIHLTVGDNKLQVVPAGDVNLWQGDSAEVYIAGYEPLTGAFDNITKDVGAHQIIFAPQVSATPARAVFFYTGMPRTGPPADRWFVRNTGTGYEIEIRTPWADLKPSTMAAPTTGKRIALTYAFNQKQDGEKAFSVYQTKTLTPFSGCTQPSCDDRFWCTPILNP